MGVFDKRYAYATAGTAGGHEYLAPDLFEAETPCGYYQGVTDQVTMSATPGFYATPLVPRGASEAEWLERWREPDSARGSSDGRSRSPLKTSTGCGAPGANR
jgi:hypothetical protein